MSLVSHKNKLFIILYPCEIKKEIYMVCRSMKSKFGASWANPDLHNKILIELIRRNIEAGESCIVPAGLFQAIVSTSGFQVHLDIIIVILRRRKKLHLCRLLNVERGSLFFCLYMYMMPFCFHRQITV